MKIENEEEYTQEQCDEINAYHRRIGFNFIIRPENCKKNPGLRVVAKNCLNSLWGKFGQNPTLDNYEFISDYNVFVRRLLDP